MPTVAPCTGGRQSRRSPLRYRRVIADPTPIRHPPIPAHMGGHQGCRSKPSTGIPRTLTARPGRATPTTSSLPAGYGWPPKRLATSPPRKLTSTSHTVRLVAKSPDHPLCMCFLRTCSIGRSFCLRRPPALSEGFPGQHTGQTDRPYGRLRVAVHPVCERRCRTCWDEPAGRIKSDREGPQLLGF
jgi:hypothetical protein